MGQREREEEENVNELLLRGCNRRVFSCMRFFSVTRKDKLLWVRWWETIANLSSSLRRDSWNGRGRERERKKREKTTCCLIYHKQSSVRPCSGKMFEFVTLYYFQSSRSAALTSFCSSRGRCRAWGRHARVSQVQNNYALRLYCVLENRITKKKNIRCAAYAEAGN